MPRIALIHAMRPSIAPIEDAFAALWPEAQLFSLLDDSLAPDRARDGALTPAMIDRFVALGRYARQAGAEAVLFTCSAFGPAIDAVAADLGPIPVHKPNSAMIAEATRIGPRIGLLASFAPTLVSMAPEFPDTVTLVTRHCEGALAALDRGDGEEHDRLAAEAAETLRDCDVIALAQFSLARAAPAVARRIGLPVLTSPDCAVRHLKKSFAG